MIPVSQIVPPNLCSPNVCYTYNTGSRVIPLPSIVRVKQVPLMYLCPCSTSSSNSMRGTCTTDVQGHVLPTDICTPDCQRNTYTPNVHFIYVHRIILVMM